MCTCRGCLAEKPVTCPDGGTMRRIRTDENWFDGDEQDIYECSIHGEVSIYVGR